MKRVEQKIPDPRSTNPLCNHCEASATCTHEIKLFGCKMKTFLLTFMLLCLPHFALAAQSSTNLVAGSYSISFTGMTFTIEPKPEDKEIRMSAMLQVKGFEITIETHDTAGKPLKMSGRIEGSDIYIWTSGVEDGVIFTYHLTGKRSTDHSASGEVSVFGNHLKAGSGKWTIAKESK